MNFRFRLLTSTLALAGSFLLPAQFSFAAGTKPSELAGAALFRDKGCAYCHGATAQGTPKGPSLSDVRKKMKAAQIESQIENGGQKMPSFQDSLSKDEVAQLVAFLRAKHRPIPLPIQPAAKAPVAVSNPEQ